MNTIETFLVKDKSAESISSGCFSVCYKNTATTVVLKTYGIHAGFAKLLTGIVLNIYFQKHFKTNYLLAVKQKNGHFQFLVRKLRLMTVDVDNDVLEHKFHNHELGTLYKDIFYPYLYGRQQDHIDTIWLDAKTDNCGYFRGELILFDSIPTLDDSKINYKLFLELCEQHHIINN